MNNLQCLLCDGSLQLLSEQHTEYKTAQLEHDGTRKWFYCDKCSAVFIKDKQSNRWYLSPKTYDRCVIEGTIDDVFEG